VAGDVSNTGNQRGVSKILEFTGTGHTTNRQQTTRQIDQATASYRHTYMTRRRRRTGHGNNGVGEST